ncbi:hypothetical protein [Lewinella sp. LCG006]|uniref:hypothetical protein n=1 Tax=Lewinella sp. LCG006 TaxID=3231911 RepID=UPI00345F498E
MQQLYAMGRVLANLDFRYSTLLVFLILNSTLLIAQMPPCANTAVESTVFDDGWQDGDNDGVGFGPWMLNPSSNSGTSGFFVATSTENGDGDTNMDGDIDFGVGRALGMYANSGGLAEAVRAFSEPVAVDGFVSGSIDNGFVDGTVGFALRNLSGENLMEFYFRQGEADYKTNDAAGEQGTGLAYTDEGMTFTITLLTPSTYELTVNTLDGAMTVYNGTLNNPGGGQLISQIRFFNANAGGGAAPNFYIGDFEVCNPVPAPVCESTASDAAAFDDGWQNGDPNGAGFGAWILSTNFNNPSNGGHFIASSTSNGDGDSNADGDIDAGGDAFGMYANSGDVSTAILPFASPMVSSATFSLDMDNGWIDGGTVGFALQNASGENLAEFYFRSGEPDYKTNDAAGEQGTGVGFTDEGLSLVYSLTSASTYSLMVTSLDGGAVFNYNGTLNSPGGGQAIVQVRLFNANAGPDGQRNAYFNNFELCLPPPAPACSITNLTVGAQSGCNATDNTYTQAITVFYQNPTMGGMLVVNGQSFAVTGSPQTITLIGLDSDGQAVDVTAEITGGDQCTLTANALFTAPEACPPCMIEGATAGAQTACQFLTNTYTQEITITYSNAPATGFLAVNGELFPITGSPQTVVLAGLNSDGAAVDVNINFTDEDCALVLEGLFTAPEGCLAEIDCNGDDTTGASYQDGWQSGDGDSDAFGPWVLNTQFGNPANGGHFIFTSTQNGDGDTNGDGDIDTGGSALGFYANSGDVSEATRPFTAPLLPGELLSFSFDNGWVDGGAVGVGLQNANTQNLVEFLFIAGDATYSIVDANGLQSTGIPFTDEGMNISILLVDATTYQLTITTLGDGNTYHFAGPLSAPIFGQVPAQVRFFNADAGGEAQRNAYVNSLEICRRFCEAVVIDLQGDCDGNGDGAITIEVLGAVPPLSYTISDDSGSTNGSSATNIIEITDLSSGVYEITITDATGCESVVEETIEELTTNLACIGDLNVTLGANCSTTITPGMVVTGFIGCVDEFIITVDDGNTDVVTGCGNHTYMLVALQNGEEIYTCWGNIFAEDKTDPIVECPDDTDAATITEEVSYFGGALSVTDAQLELANYSCFLEILSPVAGLHYYDTYTFTVTTTDVYTFIGELIGPAFNANIALYAGDFNPDEPCQNIIGHSEALNFLPVGNLLAPGLRMVLPLQADQTYTLFVSSRTPANATGDYRIYTYADGDGSIPGLPFEETNVPLQLALPLICTDIDEIVFDFPQSWIVNADGTLDVVATRNTFFGGSQTALNAFLEKLGYTGIPVATDNCGQVLVTVSDVVTEAGDCGSWTVSRTFSVADRYNSNCIGAPRTDVCTQIITVRKPMLADLFLPPFTVPIECDEAFTVDANGNPSADVTGYPFVHTTFGYQSLNQSYCNLGASYSDEPRIVVCDGAYKFRREWNIIDWCNPGGSIIANQLIKVGDFTGPEITGIPAVINVSTSPFGCLANIAIPTPTITDGNGCSSVFLTSYTVLAFGESFFAGGNIADGDVVQAPIGTHTLILCAEDACGNETCEEYTVVVTDDIEPTASCNDDINVSIGGGDVANGIEGIARLFAADVDEGSNDNCGEVTLEVRRNYWRNNTCDASASRWSPWGDFVDFYCCDIDNEITIELRVTDEAGNTNICWQVVTPEDKLNPFCYAPAPVTLTCSDLPLAFPGDIATAYDEDFAATSTMMSAIFGGATGTDNCAVDTIVERTPNLQVNDCGWGTITRRFEAWQLRPEGDANGNGAIDINEVYRSTNSCSQLITITEVHDFTIDFPEDADADCGDPDVPTIITTTVGCDVLSVNIGEPVIFSATGDECYKFSITYDVINWCVWDGEYEGLVLPRMTEDDGEALPVDRAVEGNERPVVRVVSGFGPVDNNCDGVADAQQGIQYSVVIDRRHNDRDGDSDIADVIYDNIPGNTPGCIPADQFGRRNYGRYIYTQFVKVYDSTAPVVAVGEYGGPTANCPNLLPGQFGDDDGNCEEAVSIPFSVSDECELFDGAGNLVVSIVSAELDAFAVDANGDGDIKSNEFVADQNVLSLITDNGDGTYVFAGTFPIITNAMGDNVYHAVRVLFEDGCGNQTSETIVFDVIDCKGPAPVCINGLTVTLMPQEDGGCAMAIWASDFEGSPISDCTGQGPELFGGLPRVTKYAIYRAADVEADPNFVPSPDDTGLVLTQDDDASTVVYVYAFDEDGNYDYCETYVLVQQHVDCGAGTGTLSGVIATEYNETIEGVEVSVNGGAVMSMTTNTDGTYSFDLELGGDYSITPYLNANPLNGVSTFDLVLMSKHVLGVQVLDSPYKRIAADINRSGSITTLDMIQLRKLILNIDTQFANNTSWRFVDAAYEFPVPTNPWHEAFPELINENNFSADILDANFVGVKIGDVNGNAQANALAGDDRTLNGQFNFEVENVSVKAGNVYTVAFRGADMASVEGFQGTLNLNGAELVDIEYGVATAENFGMRYAAEGQITTSWNGKATSEDVLFSLVIRPTVDAELSDVINVSSRYTAAEAYPSVLADISPERGEQVLGLGVVFSGRDALQSVFTVYQNTPNPFAVETLIGFNLPEDAEATVTISDASGRVLTVVRGDYAAGYNTINLTKEMIQGATGVLTYTVTARLANGEAGQAGEFTATKKMIAVK